MNHLHSTWHMTGVCQTPPWLTDDLSIHKKPTDNPCNMSHTWPWLQWCYCRYMLPCWRYS